MMQRDYYLKTLGIVQYVPKEFFVPEAAVAELETAPGPDIKPIAQQPVVVEKVAKKPPVELQPVEPKAAPSAKPVEQSPAVKDEPPLRFAMCHWLVANTLVFSALDYDQNPPQNQHQLLANILRSIGRLPSTLAEPELVQWPVVASAPGGAQEARAMFSSLLRGRVEQSGCDLVLVMGQRASQFLLPEEGSGNLPEQCQLVVTPGLGEMLADPTRKRDTWNLLRPLAEVPAQ